jgi:hypothetical protein
MSTNITPHLIGSAERWGDQAFARICKIIVDSNDGINQSVMENRTNLFEIMSVDQLIKGDDLGLSVAYSSIYYDQPDIISYLHKRGVDLSQPCDPMDYGTPIFYAVMMGRLRLIELLHKLGYSLQKPCETTFNQTPLHYAKKRGVGDVIEFITKVVTREERAKNLLHKNIMCRYHFRKYQAAKKKIILLQTLYRGRLARARVKRIRSGEYVESESESESNADESDSDEKSKTSLSHVEEESNEDEETDVVDENNIIDGIQEEEEGDVEEENEDEVDEGDEDD